MTDIQMFGQSTFVNTSILLQVSYNRIVNREFYLSLVGKGNCIVNVPLSGCLGTHRCCRLCHRVTILPVFFPCRWAILNGNTVLQMQAFVNSRQAELHYQTPSWTHVTRIQKPTKANSCAVKVADWAVCEEAVESSLYIITVKTSVSHRLFVLTDIT